MKRILHIGGLVVLMVAARPASANSFGLAYDYYLDGYVGACGQPSYNLFDSGNLQPSGPTGASSVTVSDTCTVMGQPVGGFATATVSAFYGSLSASGNGYAIPVNDNSGGGSRSIEYVAGGPLVSFTDDLTITSSTLASGTSVNLTFALGFTGSASFTSEFPGDPSDAFASGEFSVTPLPSGARSEDVTFGVGNNTQLLQITTTVGSTFEIDGYVYGGGDATSQYAVGPSSFSYSGSLNADISGITSGACVSTASGTDYGQNELCGNNFASSPEPPTLILFAIAAPGMILARRRLRSAYRHPPGATR